MIMHGSRGAVAKMHNQFVDPQQPAVRRCTLDRDAEPAYNRYKSCPLSPCSTPDRTLGTSLKVTETSNTTRNKSLHSKSAAKQAHEQEFVKHQELVD